MAKPSWGWVASTVGLIVVLCAASAYVAYLWERGRATQVENDLRARINSLEAGQGQTSNQTSSNATTNSSDPCDSSSLKLTQAATSGAAGMMGIAYAVTNTGNHVCTVSGYPNVTLADGVGQQVGQPAEASSNVAGAAVTLQPHAAAYVTVLFPNPDNFAPGVCSAQTATMLRLTPDSQSQALTTSLNSQPYCPGFATQAFTAIAP